MFASHGVPMFPPPSAPPADTGSSSFDASPFRFDINQASTMATVYQPPASPIRHSTTAYGQVGNRGSSLATAVFPRGEQSDAHQYTAWTPQPSYHMLNSRPLTAPSTSMSPYYQQGYAPNHVRHPSGPMGPPMHVQQPVQQPWPAVLDQPPSSFRGRGFSLPDLTVPGLPDEPSHANASPFLYAPPPLAPQQTTPTFNLGLWQQQQQQQRPATATASTYRSFSHSDSRPTTASDRPDTASSSTSTLYGVSTDSENNSTAGRMVSGGGPGTSASSPHKKRPRRRFEEIDRMYTCNYPGCTKGYGTLNHLNAHVTMQRHGPKRVPGEFKELRKAWRDRKKAAEAKREAEEEAEDRDRTPSPPRSAMNKIITTSAPTTLPSSYPHLSPDVALPTGGITNGDSTQWGAYPQPFMAPYPARTTAVHPNGHEGRPQTAPAPLAYPHSLRPSTAPSTETGDFSFLSTQPQHHDLPLPLSSHHPLPLGNAYRRSSLPTSSLLPTLPEALDDGSQFSFNPTRPPSPGVSF